jgi:hypothetical protein
MSAHLESIFLFIEKCKHCTGLHFRTYLRTWRHLREMMKQVTGENCIMTSFVSWSHHTLQLRRLNQERLGGQNM